MGFDVRFQGVRSDAGPFRVDDDAVQLSAVQPREHLVIDVGQHRFALRGQNDLRAARHAGVQRDVPAFAAHDFHDRDAFVRRTRVADLADRVQNGVDRRVEPYRVIGICQVVVDRAGQEHDRETRLYEGAGAPHGPVAAHDDKAFDAQRSHDFDGFGRAARFHEMAASGRLQDRAAPVQDIAHVRTVHPHKIARQQAFIAAVDAVDFHSFRDAAAHDGADRSIHSRRISAAC